MNELDQLLIAGQILQKLRDKKPILSSDFPEIDWQDICSLCEKMGISKE